MAHKELSSASPPTTGGHSAEPARLDADFDARWAAWHARGVADERAVRRKFLSDAQHLPHVTTRQARDVGIQ